MYFLECNTAPFMISILANLFDVDSKPLRKWVKAPRDKRSIKLIADILNERDIRYNRSMITTWENIRTNRNMEVHSSIDPKRYMELLSYFGLPTRLSPNYTNLWDNILEKFITSLEQFLDALNSM